MVGMMMASPAKGLNGIPGPHCIKYAEWYLACCVELLAMPRLPAGPSMPCPFPPGLHFVIVEPTDFGALVRFPHIKSLKGSMLEVSTGVSASLPQK